MGFWAMELWGTGAMGGKMGGKMRGTGRHRKTPRAGGLRGCWLLRALVLVLLVAAVTEP
jgi:hypothetical protein